MNKIANGRSSRYWRELGLVVIGAAIGLFSSLSAAYLQTKTQTDQFWLDKKLGAIREYSIASNQGFTAAGIKLEKYRTSLENILFELEDGKHAPEALVTEVFKNQEIATSEISNLLASLNINRTLIYALFRDKPPDLKFDLSDINEGEMIAEFRAKYAAARNEKERIQVMHDLYSKLVKIIKRFENNLIEGMNKVNGEIMQLAARLHT